MIEKFLNRKCIGYSADFKQTHIKHRVKMRSGEIKTMYSTDTYKPDGTETIGELKEEEPYVSIRLISTEDKREAEW